MEGLMRKMKVQLGEDGLASYALNWGDSQPETPMNSLLGRQLRLTWQQKITCVHCGRATKKSFNQGYCFPCSQKLAQCDLCIVKPSRCSYATGGCREPEWGLAHCMIPHVVYLANSSGIKIGITRAHQKLTRWLDQGASAALVLGEVTNRKQAGDMEDFIAKTVADKTDWRKLLKGAPEPIDLVAEKARILSGEGPWDGLKSVDDAVVAIKYPVNEYPLKVVSLNMEKEPKLEARLQGIKGQYLIFDKGVINIRKYTGYHMAFDVLE